MGLRSYSGFVEDYEKVSELKESKSGIKKKIWTSIAVFMLVATATMVITISPHTVQAPQTSDKMIRAVDAKVGVIVSSDTSAVYGGGAYPLDAIAAARMFEWMGAEVEMVDLDDIIQGRLSLDNFDILYFGGGNAYFWKTEDQDKSFTQYIRDYVNNGGNYIGVCAGSYFASDQINWNGRDYDYPLDLFMGKGVGPIADISDYGEAWALATIRITDSSLSYDGQQFEVMYYWGPYFEQYADSNQDVQVVAVYDYNGDADEKPAMIKFPYGNGKVFLSGVHPEFEESASIDDDRDWSFSDDWGAHGAPMVDPESEWPLIEEIVEWMLPNKVKMVPESEIREAPPQTPYRAAVYAGCGAATRTLYSTMKMLKHFGIQPYGWDNYSNGKISINDFDMIVFPNGYENVMNNWIDDSMIDQFVADGGDIIGIGGGTDMVWNDLGYSISALSDHLIGNLNNGVGDGLVHVTVNNAPDSSLNGDYTVALWIDGSSASSSADWDSGVSYDPIYWTGDSSYAIGYFTDSDSGDFAMIKYVNPKGDGTNAQVFLTAVDPSTEETTSTNRDATYWDNDDYNDPESEWDLGGSVLEWMGYNTKVPEFSHTVVVFSASIFLGALILLRRRGE
jgi:glutamine amidotransferase-like uncharacterized protein